MENNVPKTKRKLSSKTVLLIALILSVVLNIAGACYISILKQDAGSIYGTYLLRSNAPDNDEYIVFQSNNEYLHYKTNEILGEGTFEETEENIYVLRSASNAPDTFFIRDKEKNTFVSSDARLFDKVSSTEMYVNIEGLY